MNRKSSPGDFVANEIVRYGAGSTALAKLHTRHAGGWSADQCMGGAVYVSSDRILCLASEDDLRMWRKCAWHRHEGIPPYYRPLIKREGGRWEVSVSTNVPSRWRPKLNEYLEQALPFVRRLNEESKCQPQ